MKTASFSSLKIAPALRQAEREVLGEGESLSSFVELSIRESIERRQSQREFIALDKKMQLEQYVPSATVFERLETMLVKTQAASKQRG